MTPIFLDTNGPGPCMRSEGRERELRQAGVCKMGHWCLLLIQPVQKEEKDGEKEGCWTWHALRANEGE